MRLKSATGTMYLFQIPMTLISLYQQSLKAEAYEQWKQESPDGAWNPDGVWKLANPAASVKDDAKKSD